MGIDPKRYPAPAAGYHRIDSERRFMWIEPDPESKVRDKWLQHPVACPICAADTELVLVYERGGMFVQVLCPNRHEWPEPLIDTRHFVAYSEQRFYAGPDPRMLWIIQAGFGEEPVVIDDYVEQIVKGYKEIAKYAGRKGKARVKRAVRVPVRKAKKKLGNVAFSPVAAVLRTAWVIQSGGVPQAAPKSRKGGRAKTGGKIPPVAAYRKAYGMQAPEKTPFCLVCSDSGRITAPGVSIPCTECEGATAPLVRAEEKARRLREGPTSRTSTRSRKTAAPRGRTRTTTSRQGVAVRAGETVTGPVSVTGPAMTTGPKSTAKKAAKTPPAAKAPRPAAAGSAARTASRPGVTVVTGVVNVGRGRITGSVQEANLPGDGQQVSVRNDGRPPAGGRAPTAEEAAAVSGALAAADKAARAAGPGASTTVQVTGKNNSVITTTTDGDATHVTGDG